MPFLCGFTGPPDPPLLDRMADTLAHRGGSVVEDLTTPTVSVRVANLDYWKRPGPEPRRPGDDLRIVVLGEPLGWTDATAAAWRRDLVARGVDGWTTRARGPWVAVVDDGPRRAVHVVRDALGARTVHYGVHEGRLFFASEARALLAVPGFPRRLRLAGLAQYLTFSFLPGTGTMLEDVFELPAGHRLTWPSDAPLSGVPTPQRWFRLEDDPEAELEGVVSEAEGVARFHAAHRRAVAARLAHLPQEEPVGVFLSGGLDSSAVTAELCAQRDPRTVRTYAIHFGDRYPNELPYARAVAERLGTAHREVLVRPEGFLSRLRATLGFLDEPIGDPITVPNFELATAVAGDGVRVVFNGEGGDPLFGGPKNLPMMLQHWYGGVDRSQGFRERAYLASYRRGYEEIPRLLTPAARAGFDPDADLEGVLTPFFEADRPRSFLHKLLAINTRLKGAHLILPKVERMLGAAGLLPMSPLFDEGPARLAFALPPSLVLHRGVEKVVIKRAYADRLPPEVIARPKSGMRVPVHHWFRGALRRTARRVLSRRALRRAGLFEPDRVTKLLAYDTQEGPGRYGLRLWMLLTFELWRRRVIEGASV